MLKLKLQYFGYLMLGKIEGRRKRRQQRMRWLDSTTDTMDMNLGKLQKMVKDREACHTEVHRVAKVRHSLAAEQQPLTVLGFLQGSR